MADSLANTTQLQALLDQGDEHACDELLSIASSRLQKLARKMLRKAAELLDISERTALRRYCRARLQLKDALHGTDE